MKTILIVEDELDIADTLASFLELSGYRTLVAQDGMEGLRKAIEMHPDLIITDLMMPKMDGDELIARLKATPTTAHIPVIMVSASRRELASPFLRKPFRPEQLLEAVETALDSS